MRVAYIAYSPCSKAVDRSPITLPMIFVAARLPLSGPIAAAGATLASHPPGDTVAGRDHADPGAVLLRRQPRAFRPAQAGLAHSVGSAADRDARDDRPEDPAVDLLNTESGIAVALLTAAVLTPTDAALGQPEVSSPKVPIGPGESIIVENRLNDGPALPFVVIGADSLQALSHGRAFLISLSVRIEPPCG